MTLSSSAYRNCAIAVLALALMLRLLGLGRGIWLDEWFSIHVIDLGVGSSFARDDVHPPLYYSLLILWSQFGMSEPWLRSLSVVFGMATVVIMVLWLWRQSKAAALVAGLVCATHPLLLRYSQEIRSYPLLGLLTVLAFFFGSRIVEQPARRGAYVGLAISFALLPATQLVGIMVVTSVVLFLVLSREALRRVHWVNVGIAIGAAWIVFFTMFFGYLTNARFRTDETWWQAPLTVESLTRTTSATLRITTVTESVERIAAGVGLKRAATYLIAVTAILSLLAWVGAGSWRSSGPLLAAVVLYWLQVSIYSALRANIVIERSLLPLLIPLSAFVGIHVVALRMPVLRKAFIVLIIGCCTLFTYQWATRRAWIPEENWKGYANLLTSRWSDGAVVIFFPSYAQRPLRYYLKDLSDTSVTEVAVDADEETIVSKVDSDAGGKLGHDAPLFLFLRTDATFQAHRGTYDKLLRRLHERFGKPIRVDRDGILELQQYESTPSRHG